jgi:hypothetical protein
MVTVPVGLWDRNIGLGRMSTILNNAGGVAKKVAQGLFTETHTLETVVDAATMGNYLSSTYKIELGDDPTEWFSETKDVLDAGNYQAFKTELADLVLEDKGSFYQFDGSSFVHNPNFTPTQIRAFSPKKVALLGLGATLAAIASGCGSGSNQITLDDDPHVVTQPPSFETVNVSYVEGVPTPVVLASAENINGGGGDILARIYNPITNETIAVSENNGGLDSLIYNFKFELNKLAPGEGYSGLKVEFLHSETGTVITPLNDTVPEFYFPNLASLEIDSGKYDGNRTITVPISNIASDERDYRAQDVRVELYENGKLLGKTSIDGIALDPNRKIDAVINGIELGPGTHQITTVVKYHNGVSQEESRDGFNVNVAFPVPTSTPTRDIQVTPTPELEITPTATPAPAFEFVCHGCEDDEQYNKFAAIAKSDYEHVAGVYGINTDEAAFKARLNVSGPFKGGYGFELWYTGLYGSQSWVGINDWTENPDDHGLKGEIATAFNATLFPPKDKHDKWYSALEEGLTFYASGRVNPADNNQWVDLAGMNEDGTINTMASGGIPADEAYALLEENPELFWQRRAYGDFVPSHVVGGDLIRLAIRGGLTPQNLREVVIPNLMEHSQKGGLTKEGIQKSFDAAGVNIDFGLIQKGIDFAYK